MKVNKILMFLIVTIFMISFASAGLLEKAEFDKLDGRYGSYHIDSYLPDWLFGGDKADIKLIENTDQCLINCKATIEGYFYEPRTLLDKIKFIDRRGEETENIKDLRFRIGQNEIVEYEIPIYEETCEDIVNNSESVTVCHNNLMRTDTKTEEEFVWKEYEGGEITGYYQLEIIAKKNINQRVDWIITVFGEELAGWAWWNSNWDKKRSITSLDGNISGLYNITYDSDMNTDFSDLRFIDFTTESIELNYSIISKIDSTNATVRVNNLGVEQIYMYYDNGGAATTSNANDTFFNPLSGYFLDSSASQNDFNGLNNGTNFGATFTSSGYIGGAYVFGANDGIKIGGIGSSPFDFAGDFSISTWVNPTSLSGNQNIMGVTLAGGSGGWLLKLTSSSTIGYQEYDGGAFTETTSSTTVSTGTFLNIVMVKTGTTARIYIDNVEVSYASQPAMGTSIDASTVQFQLGNNGDADEDFVLDEAYLYDFALSSDQRTALFNQTQPNFVVGPEVPNTGITTTSLVPVDNLETTIQQINFSVSSSSTGFAQMDNVTLFIWNSNNSLIISNFTALDSNTSVVTNWTNTLEEDVYTWNAETCGEAPCDTSANRTLTIHFTAPTVDVTSPSGILDYIILGNNETLLYNISETGQNLTEHLDACWYEYNRTNNSLNCSANSTSFTYIFGVNNLTVYANDTFGLIASDTATWDYKIIEINQTFNNITTEGATEQFTINLVKNSGFQISTIDLIYNETSNSFPYSVSGDEITAQSSITIPVVDADTNVSFYWDVTLDDSSNIITDTNNQTILSINVDNCSSFTNIIYNFTQYDEENKSILSGNNTIELQINLFDTLKTSLLTSFSNKFEAINPVQFCAEAPLLPTVNYSSYVIVKYFVNSTSESKAYSVEYYNILNQTIGNTTIPINVALYNLKVSDTTKFRLTFRDDEYVLAPNILVQVHRQYIQDNGFTVVEIPLTDSNGQTILNLVKNTIIYNFIMVNEAGETVGTFNSIAAFCSDFSIGDCTINLAPDSPSEDMYDYNEEFDISISDPSYDNSTKKISVSFVTADLTPKNVRMEIVRNNDFGNRSVCSDSLFSASGTLSCDVSAITDTDQFLFISTFVEDDLAKKDTTNLNANILNFGTLNGAFYAFLFILILITMFMEDRKVLVISLGLGWVSVISLGLMNGKFIGFTSAGIWILVSIGVFLWKLNKEDPV